MISGIKQHLVPLFNLILAIYYGLKSKSINEQESDFFFKHLYL